MSATWRKFRYRADSKRWEDISASSASAEWSAAAAAAAEKTGPFVTKMQLLSAVEATKPSISAEEARRNFER